MKSEYFVSYSKSYYIWSGIYISVLKHCRKIKFRLQLHYDANKQNLGILPCFNTFVTRKASLPYIQCSEGVFTSQVRSIIGS